MDLPSRFIPEAQLLNGISLCAGYAGLDLGLHIAEPAYRTVAFVERESHAAAALVARMADEALGQAAIWDDLRSFDGRPWRERVHLLSAGYPCQPFSYAGKRGGEEDPRHLWPEVARIADEVRPRWIFCENVEGHLTLGFADVAASLRALGYTTKAGLFTAREAGASHRRRRLFLLAYADSERRRVFPGPRPRTALDPVRQAERDSGCERRPILYQQRGACMDGFLQFEEETPLFAPGPADLAAWEQLLRRRADLKPAILRADHGLADRVDRTRGAGNGVSSMAAALAWAVLKTAHQLPS